MLVNQFDYCLPTELIAHYPLPERSASRLQVVDRKKETVIHQQFVDLLEWLQPNDLLVFNNTKVVPARLFGKKESGGRVEVLVERILDSNTALMHIKASKSPKAGQTLLLENALHVHVIARQGDLFKVHVEHDILSSLEQYGHVPLPPYIARSDEPLDQTRYQTVYAKEKGAVAAPTAGLHFDEALLEKLTHKGIKFAYLTLHVGAGTFQPVRVENIKEHVMHTEFIEVPQTVCDSVLATKQVGGRVIAVGTTSVRALETASQSGTLKPFRGDTAIFIYPGFHFHCIDGVITNFHLPKSTLLMLVCAFGGYELIMRAYSEAIKEKYRFFSYGDAMLIV